MLDPLWDHSVQFSSILTVEPTVNMLRTMEPTVDKFEDQKVDKVFLPVRFCPAPPPPLRRKLLDPRMSVMLFSELMEYNKGMSDMLGISIYWTVEDF